MSPDLRRVSRSADPHSMPCEEVASDDIIKSYKVDTDQ